MKTLNKYIDHTNLKPDSKQEVIRKLCSDAREWDFASVCVNPCNIPLAKQLLEGTTVKVCTVIGFPLGQNTTKVKVAETEDAYAMGCDEFDMVINVGRLKDGEEDYVRNEIAAVVAAAKGKTVKVIIETGLLTDQEKATATRLSCEAGAHFVKTCTGVSQGVATVADIKLMKANLTGAVELKASSGIRTYEDAQALINAGANRLGTSAGIAIITGAPKN
ncbi:MAG: deoxyribose-phosphate aldolase [Clostridia bacterium]|jgi:deoxyribose-phosphate aldolase|nr:deoxyribose-phosphate aldolase [Clostridia bacterium]MBQ1943235.1 deoxyribose-phosphate aldolase [Clostridia bacterium]